MSNTYTKYTLDFIFSSKGAQGFMNTWGYAGLNPDGKWEQLYTPHINEHLPTLSPGIPFSIKFFDTDYAVGDPPTGNETTMEIVVIGFKRQDKIANAPQSPLISLGGGTSNDMQWYASPQLPPDQVNGHSYGTNLNGAMWEIPGTGLLKDMSFTLGNGPALFDCLAVACVVMPDNSRKAFIIDPEMDVEAGG